MDLALRKSKKDKFQAKDSGEKDKNETQRGVSILECDCANRGFLGFALILVRRQKFARYLLGKNKQHFPTRSTPAYESVGVERVLL